MAAVEAAENRPNESSRGRGNRARGGRPSRGRGSRGGRGNHQRNHQVAERSNEQQGTAAPTLAERPASEASRDGSAPRGRGRRGARGPRRDRAAIGGGQRTTIAAGRAFGGRLTAETGPEDQSSESPTSLNASASTFVPGQPFVQPRLSTEGANNISLKPARRPSKSNAPDLPTRIHEDISNGQYECVICTNEVLRNSRIWSCSICWTATHMSCVKKWFTNRIKPPEQEQQPQPQVWRCPGCNSTMNDEPGVYHCWCAVKGNVIHKMRLRLIAHSLPTLLHIAIAAKHRLMISRHLGNLVSIPFLIATSHLNLVELELQNVDLTVRGLGLVGTLRTHSCNKLCHRSGACEDQGIIGSHCQQPCGKTRSCGHLDTEQCHAPYPCKEEKPCQSKIFVTCECQHRKQEVKCSATKAQPSPQRPLLKCDDECLRLQRNARLANALNIDPQTHTDDHVPYSDTTLKLYRESPQWAHIYEREFRVFAGDRTEKRLRFKPMKSNQRAFIHSLAEDFGFDSESSDPEPHRHVCLFKTPRFVSTPLKTLAQCAKIRASQDSSAQQSTMANDATTIPYNALLLTNPQFGLTIEELDSALKKEYAAHPTVKFHTSFLPSEEVVIRGSGTWTSQTLEASLTALKSTLRQTVRRLKLAENVCLCSVDDSLNVLRREESQARGEGGWSAVVGRTTARPKPTGSLASPASVSLRSKFVALRKEPKKKVEEEPVEEDWEAAAEKLAETPEAA
ncbi:hypothetical protein FHL15_008876 [Xylaria flabelliformis]|uniref:R3H domain-containing protein n=1 Tax=Xylaria flabelliformis TaxID=2512241 RepID=A0A553HQA9_9PEZI|nr:hypothetical protein FHL15_008876 [Xylaria flabelliformis]